MKKNKRGLTGFVKMSWFYARFAATLPSDPLAVMKACGPDYGEAKLTLERLETICSKLTVSEIIQLEGIFDAIASDKVNLKKNKDARWGARADYPFMNKGRTNFVPADAKKHDMANEGYAVSDYCANCNNEYMAHTNGVCPR